jgi:GNAT superfamily N-acetyltransferase
MQNLQIRPADEADVPVILDFIRRLAKYERRPQDVTATEGQIRETLFGVRPAADVLLAYWESECAGFAVFFGTYSTFGAQPGIYLEDVYVKEHLRGKGIGSALMRRVAEISAERGGHQMVWSVLDWNESAIRYYKNMGAEQVTGAIKMNLKGAAFDRLVMKATNS